MIDLKNFKWNREPESYEVLPDRIEVVTKPHTDLWQRTYYHFRNDNAPVFQMETEEKYFSFVVKTEFQDSHHRFDQCGIVMYLDSENWLKGSIEYENEQYQHLARAFYEKQEFVQAGRRQINEISEIMYLKNLVTDS